MENSVFVSVGVKDDLTLISIRQFNKEDGINKDGVMIPIHEFASFMFQLKAIEQSFISTEQYIEKEEVKQEEQVEEEVDGKKSDLKKRLNATINERKRKQPPVAVVKSKQKPKTDPITMAFARALHGHIKSIVTSQCLGCMMNLMDHHDVCINPPMYVENFFSDALAALEDAEVFQLVDRERKKNPKVRKCPSKTVLQADSAWCERVKGTIIDLLC